MKKLSMQIHDYEIKELEWWNVISQPPFWVLSYYVSI